MKDDYDVCLLYDPVTYGLWCGVVTVINQYEPCDSDDIALDDNI